MKPVVFFFLVTASATLYPAPSLAQSPAQRDSNVISVQELAMPGKAVRAFEKGIALLVKGDAQASLAYFQTVIELAPTSFRPYHNLGIAHFRLDQLDAAEKDFQKSVDLSKGSFAPSLFGLAIISYRRAEFAQAESLVRQGLFLTPSSAVGKYCLGLVQFSLGRLADAQRSALEALRLDPADIDAHLLLAHVHERLHDPAAVITDVQSYLRHSPNRDLESDALALLQQAQQDLARLSTSAQVTAPL